MEENQENFKTLSSLVDDLAISTGKEFERTRRELSGEIKYNFDLLNLRIDILNSKIDNGFDELIRQIAKIAPAK